MPVDFSKKGKPILQMPSGISFVLTHMEAGNVQPDKWKWVHVTGLTKDIEMTVKKKGAKSREILGKETPRDIVPLDLAKLKTSIISTKNKNKYAKVFKKYTKDGFIHKADLEKLYRDLKDIDDEVSMTEDHDLVERIDVILTEKKPINKKEGDYEI
uniref:Uncharacterized protein n=1 Tax=viral metagenome TaxID=1070528 RepID=A0A6M3IRN6_9ZZZZ